MKILIWLFCAFIYSFIVTVLSYVGISLGGLPTALLAGFLILIAKRMCKKLDASKIADENDTDDIQPLPTVNETHVIGSPAPNEVLVTHDSPSPSPAMRSVAKQRFCKLCGHPIDHDTKKCTHCGKQYFRNPLRSIPISTIVFFCFLCISSAVFISQINSKQEEIAVLNSTISELQSTIDLRERTINEYKSQIDEKNKRMKETLALKNELEEKSYFVDSTVAFIRDDGSREYHKCTCLMYKYSSSPSVIHSIDTAKRKGYKACWYCY